MKDSVSRFSLFIFFLYFRFEFLFQNQSSFHSTASFIIECKNVFFWLCSFLMIMFSLVISGRRCKRACFGPRLFIVILKVDVKKVGTSAIRST